MCIFKKRPQKYCTEAFREAAILDMPPSYYKEPTIYEPKNIKKTIIPGLAIIVVFVIGYFTIQLKFNETDIMHITRQTLSLIIPVILIIPLHELTHGGACYLLTHPHCRPKFGRKGVITFYTYLSPGVFLSKTKAIIGLIAPLILLTAVPILICLLISTYEMVIALSVLAFLSAGAASNDIDHAIMLRSKENDALIAFRHGYNVIYPA